MFVIPRPPWGANLDPQHQQLVIEIVREVGVELIIELEVELVIEFKLVVELLIELKTWSLSWPWSFFFFGQAKLNEYEFPVKKVANVQSQLSRLIEKNYYLNKSAREVRKGKPKSPLMGLVLYR